ncbi:MAG: hypothetical protein K9N07_11335 [Candidatus Cloacimonetes bacterium]|nr:hypothetical protein [Candidatus Cloacimonadota bacterium]
MGQLILNLGKKKTNLPKELNEVKENGFLSTQYSLKEIKKMISDDILTKKTKINYAEIIKQA